MADWVLLVLGERLGARTKLTKLAVVLLVQSSSSTIVARDVDCPLVPRDGEGLADGWYASRGAAASVVILEHVHVLLSIDLFIRNIDLCISAAFDANPGVLATTARSLTVATFLHLAVSLAAERLGDEAVALAVVDWILLVLDSVLDPSHRTLTTTYGLGGDLPR
jgi:nucleotide-binding universal stress UspA family protein